MSKFERSLLVVAVGTCLLGAAGARAQETGNVIGPPQLRDFQLTPKQTIVTQPEPNAQRPVQVAPPPPTSRPATPPAERSPERPARRTPQAAPTQPVQTAPAATVPSTVQPAPAETAPTLGTPLPAETAPPAAAPAPAPPAEAAGGIPWYAYALGLGLLALAGAAFLRRRRRDEDVAEPEVTAVTPAAPSPPRADPVPRPWLELDLKTNRASFTETEAVIQFELSIANTGGSPARNLRIDVKMINAGREQDQEIGAFFKTAGRTVTKLNLPGIGADSTGVIRGEVAMPLEEMRAVKLDGRMLFIPVVAVNALYDYGENRTGHSAKSYVVGRELQESADKPAEKMGAFRVDQGPRIWRTVGQRPHRLAKRV